MTNTIASNTGKSASDLAKKIAQQIANEPLEILKDVGEQTAGLEYSNPDEKSQDTPQKPQQNEQDRTVADQLRMGRRMEALNRELDDMRKQKLFSELQRRISEGETIALEEYPELSMEQKQVLNAQMEAVRVQIQNQQSQNTGVLVEPASRKGRQLFNFGKKTALKREQTHVEKITPPSQ